MTPSVLSLDIETDPAGRRLLAVALHGGGADEVYIVDPAGRALPDRAVGCASEREALDAVAGRVRELDPDVLTGWNVVDFDLKVLDRIAGRTGAPLELGRDAGPLRLRPPRGWFGSGEASIPGRLVLDGMDLVRGAFLRFDDYTLDRVASEVLGEGKVALGGAGGSADAGGRDATGGRAEAIQARYRDDLDTFVAYARTDARLALEIVQKLDLVTLAMARSRLTGMTPDRVSASIASFDFLYLMALGRRGVVAPTVRSDDARVSRHQAGGDVFEPVTGIHENVWVFDFRSLYPSVIRTFNIDPLGYVEHPAPGDAVVRLSDDTAFRRGDAILPAMLDELFPRREAAKRAGDAVASQAVKILMNSFYGVLGTPACRFHNVAVANAVTGMGRRLLRWSKRWFEERGFDVLYGDTDSLFVRSGLPVEEARNAGPRLRAGAERGRRRPRLRRVAGDEPPGPGAREAVPEARPAVRPARPRRGAQALRGAGRRPPRGRVHRAWRWCAATGRTSPRTCSASSTRGSSRANRWTATSRTPSPPSAGASSTTSSSTARACGNAPPRTRRARPRTSPPPASRGCGAASSPI